MRNRRGYILLELVLGAAITCAMSAVLFHLAVASQSALAIQGNAADQQQRLRVVVQALRHDLMMAGAGPTRGTRAGPLIAVFPPVIPDPPPPPGYESPLDPLPDGDVDHSPTV